MNSYILCLHITAICGLTLVALYYGKEVLIAWLAMVALATNLFVLKQITLFGLNVTASEALAVGYLLGLNLIQEYFGQTWARKCMWISLFVSCGFTLLSQIHLLYIPNQADSAHTHFTLLFKPMPRIILSSLFSFFICQLLDLTLFNFLRKKTTGKYLTLRTVLVLLVSQIVDTLLFTFIGLYGLVASTSHVIILSLAAKIVVIFCSAPFVSLSKKVRKHVQV
jgi:queuosine precursor transporter